LRSLRNIWRALTTAALPFVRLDPATRTYTVSGLAAQPYEVVVRNKVFGPKIVTGTPLP
jgi:hypothetical protein